MSSSNKSKRNDDEGVVVPELVHECTSLEVIMGKRMLQAWNGMRKSVRIGHTWRYMYDELREVRKVSMRFRNLICCSDSSKSRCETGPSTSNGSVHMLVVGRGPNKPYKLRAVFRGNDVHWDDSPRALLREYAAEPVTMMSSCMMDLWTCVPDSYARRAPMFVKWERCHVLG